MGNQTVDQVARLFCQATKKTLDKSTGKNLKFASTLQDIPKVSLKPAVGCFVQFNGDYNGLVIMNFTAGAAMELYRSYMLTMGMPESELVSDYTSAEVVDTIGEMTNQIMGRALRMVESNYELSSSMGQPKAIALTSAITLTPDAEYQVNRRISFSLETYRFYMELSLERTEFIPIK
ncbi:DUF3334 family protein [Desulfurivibrio dismutans]|uniref:DUF3334 family protein n=1 Tax=Desulfurivibrio dismutans TaxID=1398908 RepID=UPI0023D9D911|nr:DUF3334 family protein [Desulfurivibrio alkaliphilus]MDF1614553.1 DUF3334 family protein [Desulfurivibrio alkaliphilus]